MEHSLDPSDWEALRLLGHRMVDDMMEYLRTSRDRKAWEKIYMVRYLLATIFLHSFLIHILNQDLVLTFPDFITSVMPTAF